MYFKDQKERKKRLNKIITCTIVSGVLSTTLLAGGVSAASNTSEEAPSDNNVVIEVTQNDSQPANADQNVQIAENEGEIPGFPDEFLDEIPGYDPSKPYVLVEEEGVPVGILFVSEELKYGELTKKLSNDWQWNQIALYTNQSNDYFGTWTLVTDPNHVLSLADILVRDEMVDYFKEHIDEINNGEIIDPPANFEQNFLIIVPALPPYEEKEQIKSSEVIEKTILDTSITRAEVNAIKNDVQQSLKTKEDNEKLIASVESNLKEMNTTSLKFDAKGIANFEVAFSILVKENNINKVVELTALFLKAAEKQQVSPASLTEYTKELFLGLDSPTVIKQFFPLLIDKLEKAKVDISSFEDLLDELN